MSKSYTELPEDWSGQETVVFRPYKNTLPLELIDITLSLFPASISYSMLAYGIPLPDESEEDNVYMGVCEESRVIPYSRLGFSYDKKLGLMVRDERTHAIHDAFRGLQEMVLRGGKSHELIAVLGECDSTTKDIMAYRRLVACALEKEHYELDSGSITLISGSSNKHIEINSKGDHAGVRLCVQTFIDDGILGDIDFLTEKLEELGYSISIE